MNDSSRIFTPSLAYLTDTYSESVLREYDLSQIYSLRKSGNVVYDNKPYVIQFSSFDSKHLGRKSGKIVRDHRYPYELDKNAISNVVQSLKKEGITYATIRFPSNYAYAQLLEDAGFRLVDSLVYLYQHVDAHVNGSSKITIRPANSEDRGWLTSKTAGAYTYGRLYQDPCITKSQADNVFVAWVENALNREACDELLVGLNNNSLVGYVGMKVLSRDASLPLASIELILVDTPYKGKGYSHALIDAAFDYCKEINIRTILIDTQISNTPALRSYQCAGFRFGSSYLTYRIAL